MIKYSNACTADVINGKLFLSFSINDKPVKEVVHTISITKESEENINENVIQSMVDAPQTQRIYLYNKKCGMGCYSIRDKEINITTDAYVYKMLDKYEGNESLKAKAEIAFEEAKEKLLNGFGKEEPQQPEGENESDMGGDKDGTGKLKEDENGEIEINGDKEDGDGETTGTSSDKEENESDMGGDKSKGDNSDGGFEGDSNKRSEEKKNAGKAKLKLSIHYRK